MWPRDACGGRHSPKNTSTVPTHCMGLMGLAKRITEARMVKNFRVVVMIEQVRGPKYTTVMKMKLWKETEKGGRGGGGVRLVLG